MSWYKISLPSPSTESVQIGYRIATAAQARDNQLGSPAGFAIFSGTEYEDENTATMGQAT